MARNIMCVCGVQIRVRNDFKAVRCPGCDTEYTPPKQELKGIGGGPIYPDPIERDRE